MMAITQLTTSSMETSSFNAGARMATFAFLLSILIAAAPRPASATITCMQVDLSILPCIGYARSGGTVPTLCCNGVRSLKSAANTTPDRQQACVCLKKIVPDIPGINMTLVAEIPGKCHVDIGYPLSPSTDCSKVK